MVLSEKVQDSYKWNNRALHINPCSCPRGRPQLTIWSVCECMYTVCTRACTCMSLCVFASNQSLSLTTRPVNHLLLELTAKVFIILSDLLFNQELQQEMWHRETEGGVGNSGKRGEKNTKTERQPRQAERELKTFKSQYPIWHDCWTTTV